MRNVLFIAILISFAITSCKPELTQSIKFEIESPNLQGEVEIAGHKFILDDSLELNTIASRLKTYGVVHEIIPTDVEFQYELKLPKDADLEAIRRILTTKGEFGFWEMYQLEELSGAFSMDSLALYVRDCPPQRSEIVVSINDTAAVSAILDRIAEQKIYPANLKLMWALKPNSQDSTSLSLYFLRGSGMKRGAAMDGHYIIETEVYLSRWAPVWEVGMRMDKVGALNWSQLTGDNIGRCLAIVIDDKVYSAPMVNAMIEGGRCRVSGDFSEQEAKEMAAILGGGALPCNIKILEEKKSSPEK